MSGASAGTWDWSMAVIRTIRMMMTVMTGTKYWTVFKAIHHDESYFLILILVLVCNFDMLGSSFVETPPKASCMSNCRLCEGGSDQLVINDRQSSICQLTEPRQLLELSAPNLKKWFTKFSSTEMFAEHSTQIQPTLNWQNGLPSPPMICRLLWLFGDKGPRFNYSGASRGQMLTSTLSLSTFPELSNLLISKASFAKRIIAQ